MRACHCTAHPAAVEAFVKLFLIDFFAHIHCSGVAAEPVIVNRQKIEIVHDSHKMRRAYKGHLILLRIETANFLAVSVAYLLDRFGIRRPIGLKRYFPAVFNDYRLYFLVAQYRADSATPSLFEPVNPASRIEP